MGRSGGTGLVTATTAATGLTGVLGGFFLPFGLVGPGGLFGPFGLFALLSLLVLAGGPFFSFGLVNAVAPGFIETDMTAALPEAVRAEMAKGIPAGRAGKPEDVANAVAFFAAEQSSYLTGQVLCADGGMAM